MENGKLYLVQDRNSSTNCCITADLKRVITALEDERNYVFEMPGMERIMSAEVILKQGEKASS